MGTARKSALLLWGMALSATGCAVFDRTPPSGDLREQLSDEHREGYVYAFGIGDTPEQARERALGDLAAGVSTTVASKHEEVFERTEDSLEDDARSSTQIRSALSTMQRAELGQVRFSGPYDVEEGYAFEAWISEQNLADAERRARFQAAALARYVTLEALDDGEHVAQLRLAAEGLEAADRYDVLDDRLMTERHGEQTFESYFERIQSEAIDRLRILPIVEDADYVRAVVIDAETFAPQSDIEVVIGGESFHTDRRGMTRRVGRDELDNEQTIALQVNGEAVDAETWTPADWKDSVETEAFFHTAPDDRPLVFDGSRMSTPSRLIVPAGGRYDYEIFGGRDFRDEEGTVSVHDDAPYLYIHREMQERDYGWLDLSVGDAAGRIRIEQKGTTVESGRLEREVEVGRYNVSILPDEDAQQAHYERIDDELVVERGERIERTYIYPRDRGRYLEGSSWRWEVLGAHSAHEDHKHGLIGDGDISIGDYPQSPEGQDQGVADIALDGGSYNLTVGHQTFRGKGWLPTYYGFRAGWGMRSMTITDKDGDEHDVSYSVVRAGPTAGLWRHLSGHRALYVGLGAEVKHRNVSDDNTDPFAAEVIAGSSTDPHVYAELGATGQSFGLHMLGSLGDQAAIMAVVSIGEGRITEHFERGRATDARSGVHYE